MAVQQPVVTSVALQVSWLTFRHTSLRSYCLLLLADEIQTVAQEGSSFLLLLFSCGVAWGVGAGLGAMVRQTVPGSSILPKRGCCVSAVGESRIDLLPL